MTPVSDDEEAKERTHVDCLRCRAFFVTHDPQHPYGCRTFAMKTRALPAQVVRQSSGRDCQAFEPRLARGERH